MNRIIGLVLWLALGITASAQTRGIDPARVDAVRLLQQASFGATETDMEQVVALGPAGWIDAQLALPATSHLQRLLDEGAEPGDVDRRVQAWWEISVRAPDQLRQRVAFAWSEILVISERNSALADQAIATAAYYDVLVHEGLGNFRDLLEQVTLNPAMGVYLGTLGNFKGDESLGTRADENYAREVMQLFTIGLVQLHADGSPVLDAQGQPLPTYSQQDVENLARVFTGWYLADATDATIRPMEPVPGYHDEGEKVVMGQVFPAEQGARADLEQALDLLFHHPNTGPFLARLLIQRLVTSNPSPAYIQRVAAVFADNGQGVRGDLAAMVKAILLDAEARDPNPPPGFGKLREPLIQLTHLWRLGRAASANGDWLLDYPEYFIGQGPLRAPSVFSFFDPDYRPVGPEGVADFTLPEMQLLSESTAVNQLNAWSYFTQFALWSFAGEPFIEDDFPLLHLPETALLAVMPEALVQHLNLLMMAGQMPDDMYKQLVQTLNALPYAMEGLPPGSLRLVDALWLMLSSPQYAVQR